MRQSKKMQQAMNMRFIATYPKYFGKKTKITVNETEYTPDQVIAAMQGQVDAEANVETTRGNYSRAVASARAKAVEIKPISDAARQAVLLQYGTNPATLAEFGLSPRKQPGPKDVATKQAAILQSQATREARHTMGSRQKEKIKGVVASVSSDTSVSNPSVAPTATASAGSNPSGAAAASVGSTVTSQPITGH